MAFTTDASYVSISSTISSRPNLAFQPQSLAASLSSIERGQLAAMAWRKSGLQSIVKPGTRLAIASAIWRGVKLMADRL